MTRILDFGAGFYPLRHHEKDYDLDLRVVLQACRIETREPDSVEYVEAQNKFGQRRGQIECAMEWEPAQQQGEDDE